MGVSFVPTNVSAWALQIPPSQKSRYLKTCVMIYVVLCPILCPIREYLTHIDVAITNEELQNSGLCCVLVAFGQGGLPAIYDMAPSITWC